MRGKGLEARLVSPEDKAFRGLLRELEQACARRYGQAGKTVCRLGKDAEVISTCVILQNGQGIACGLIQTLEEDCAQLLCLYVKPEYRRKGLARDVIQTLELQGMWQGCMTLAMAVTKEMKEAVAMGKNLSFQKAVPWGIYKTDKAWMCLKKEIE